MNNSIYLGYIGGARLWLEPDTILSTLIIEATPQGTWLARLLSPDPPRPMRLHQPDRPQVPALRIPYTPDVDRLIVELVEVLGGARYRVPGLVQLSLLEAPNAAP